MVTHSDISDLLLGTPLFRNSSQSLKESLDSVDLLAHYFHHLLELSLVSHHLGRIDLDLLHHFLLSKPLGDIWV